MNELLVDHNVVYSVEILMDVAVEGWEICSFM